MGIWKPRSGCWSWAAELPRAGAVGRVGGGFLGWAWGEFRDLFFVGENAIVVIGASCLDLWIHTKIILMDLGFPSYVFWDMRFMAV